MSVNKFPPKPKYDPDTGPVYLYGLHTVRAALDNPRREKRELLATPNALARLRETGDDRQDPAARDDAEGARPAARRRRGAPGRGARGRRRSAASGSTTSTPLRLVVVLDQVTDPHNVGAILRTACAFGADALITTQRYAPRETGVMAKAASGALDLVPLIEVRNLGDALETLKQRGMRVIGFDSEAPAPLRAARRRRGRWRSCSAPRARACGSGRASSATRWCGSTCRGRSSRSTSRTPRPSRSSPPPPAGHRKGPRLARPFPNCARADHGVQRTIATPSMVSASGEVCSERRVLAASHASVTLPSRQRAERCRNWRSAPSRKVDVVITAKPVAAGSPIVAQVAASLAHTPT